MKWIHTLWISLLALPACHTPTTSPAVTIHPTPETTSPPPSPSTQPKTIRLVAGLDEFCAVLDNGKVRCWGGSPMDALPRDLPGIDNAVDVATLPSDMRPIEVVVRNDGSVLSIGRNDEKPRIFKYLSNVRRVHGNTMSYDGDIFGGVLCSVHRDGKVSCIKEKVITADATPVVIPGWEDVGELSVSTAHTCALMSKGIECVFHGALNMSEKKKVMLPQGEKAVSIRAGHTALCVLFESGEVACKPIDDSQTAWQPVPGTKPFSMIQPGYQEADHPIVCTQQPSKLTCSHLTTIGSGLSLPCLEQGDFSLEGFSPIEEVTLTQQTACLRDSQGVVACVGHNAKGGLGQPLAGYVAQPEKVPNIPPMTKVQVGDGFTCALSITKEVWCWGPTPEPVASLSGMDRLIANAAYACAWDPSHRAHCFFGTDKTRRPRPQPALDHAIAVGFPTMGVLGSAAALFDDGSVRIGNNPDFDSLDRLQLRPAQQFHPAKDLAMSPFGTLIVLKNNGEVLHGRVNRGVLVTGPTQTRALQLATQVQTGQALMPDGTVRRWSDLPSLDQHQSWGQDVTCLVGPSSCALTSHKELLCRTEKGVEKIMTGIIQADGAPGDLHHLCGVDEQGTMYCMGNNKQGQCGVQVGIDHSPRLVVVDWKGIRNR